MGAGVNRHSATLKRVRAGKLLWGLRSRAAPLSMTISNITELLIALCLELWLLVLLVHRRVRKHFPVFCYYIAISVPVTVARLLTASHYQLYFSVYWLTNIGMLLLGLVALHQVFRWVYEGFYQWLLFRVLYYGVIVLVLAVSVANALVNPPTQAHPLVALALDIGIAVNLLQAGIGALFQAFLRPLRIQFRKYPYGVVLGFFVSAAGPLLGYLARSVFGIKWQLFARYASPVSYILALAVWLSAFIVPQKQEVEWTPPMSPEQMIQELETYMKALRFGKK
jgi:hypothetical protein